jgi:hypothetical protein
VAKNFTKFKIILFLNWCRKKPEPVDKILQYFLPKKVVISCQKYGFGIRDPKKLIPDLGFKCQKGTGSRIRNTGGVRKESNLASVHT